MWLMLEWSLTYVCERNLYSLNLPACIIHSFSSLYAIIKLHKYIKYISKLPAFLRRIQTLEGIEML